MHIHMHIHIHIHIHIDNRYTYTYTYTYRYTYTYTYYIYIYIYNPASRSPSGCFLIKFIILPKRKHNFCMKKTWFGFMSFSLAFFCFFFSLVWVFTSFVALWPWLWEDQSDSPSAIESFLCTSKSFCWFCFLWLSSTNWAQLLSSSSTSCRCHQCDRTPHLFGRPCIFCRTHLSSDWLDEEENHAACISPYSRTRSSNIMYKFQRRIIA